MTTTAARALRILLLTDEGLVPDRPRKDLNGRDAELRKTEYDVVGGLESLGHEVAYVGVGGELSAIREAIDEKKPHIAFNPGRTVRQPAVLRSACGQLSGTQEAEVYRLQSARADACA
jgi:hypothetical protein